AARLTKRAASAARFFLGLPTGPPLAADHAGGIAAAGASGGAAGAPGGLTAAELGTVTSLPQAGHRAGRPSKPSGARSSLPQVQAKVIGMVNVSKMTRK